MHQVGEKEILKMQVNSIGAIAVLKRVDDFDVYTMSSENQERHRPNIETAICQTLEGNAQKEALFIIDNIRDNKMKIKWSSVNVWTVKFRGRHVCDLTVVHGSLRIGHVSDVLATRVNRMSNDFEQAKRFMDAIANSTAGEPATVLAGA